MRDNLKIFRCSHCMRTLDYYQVEFNNKIYCSDKCCAKDNYTTEQYQLLYSSKRMKERIKERMQIAK